MSEGGAKPPTDPMPISADSKIDTHEKRDTSLDHGKHGACPPDDYNPDIILRDQWIRMPRDRQVDHTSAPIVSSETLSR
jgi:hypothetical protein